VNPKTPAETPKTTEKPADTGAGKPGDVEATKEARKPRKAKAASEVSKKPRGKKA
jgi:NADH-quinone oxidoreductase subunit C